MLQQNTKAAWGKVYFWPSLRGQPIIWEGQGVRNLWQWTTLYLGFRSRGRYMEVLSLCSFPSAQDSSLHAGLVLPPQWAWSRQLLTGMPIQPRVGLNHHRRDGMKNSWLLYVLCWGGVLCVLLSQDQIGLLAPVAVYCGCMSDSSYTFQEVNGTGMFHGWVLHLAAKLFFLAFLPWS